MVTRRAIQIIQISFLLVVTSTAAYGKEIYLFDETGRQIAGYREILDQLKPGDVLVFGNGKYKFLYNGFLGAGNTTEVLRVTPLNAEGSKSEIALRVPINEGTTDYNKVRHETPFTKFIEMYKNGSVSLERSGIRVPKIFSSYKNQFAAVEMVSSSFNLKEFLDAEESLTSTNVYNEAEKALYQFVRSAKNYETIGDFNDTQLVYDATKKTWVLIDFTDKSRKIPLLRGSAGGNHPFQVLFYGRSDPQNGSGRTRRILKNIQTIVDRGGLGCTNLFKRLMRI